jgi:hypothetical protein
VVLTVASLYFGLLALGCLAPLPLVKLQEVGQGFYRFFGFTCVALEALSLGSFLWAGDSPSSHFKDPSFLAGILFLSATLSFTLSLRSRTRWLVWTLFMTAVLSGTLATCILPREWWPIGWRSFHVLSSALVMGFATLAMMLGHWYLVTPKLSITPLKRFAGGYILLCAWKALELAVLYWIYVGASWTMPKTEMGYTLAHREVIFVLFRVTWGVLAPLGFSYWIWETVKMKATQSATGILYAAMVCTLIGEGIGLFLTLRTGVPF